MSGESRQPARGAPRLVAFAFVAAFALTVLTVIYTGLLVEAPHTRISAGLPTVAMTAGQRRDINLVFTAKTDVADAVLLVEVQPLPSAAGAGSTADQTGRQYFRVVQDEQVVRG